MCYLHLQGERILSRYNEVMCMKEVGQLYRQVEHNVTNQNYRKGTINGPCTGLTETMKW